jgi:hypothetical protein
MPEEGYPACPHKETKEFHKPLTDDDVIAACVQASRALDLELCSISIVDIEMAMKKNERYKGKRTYRLLEAVREIRRVWSRNG